MLSVRVEMFSKAGCCLCDEAKVVLDRARQRIPFELAVVDIAADPALLEQWGTEIPVVFIDGRKAFKYRVDEAELMRKLSRAGAAVQPANGAAVHGAGHAANGAVVHGAAGHATTGEEPRS